MSNGTTGSAPRPGPSPQPETGTSPAARSEPSSPSPGQRPRPEPSSPSPGQRPETPGPELGSSASEIKFIVRIGIQPLPASRPATARPFGKPEPSSASPGQKPEPPEPEPGSSASEIKFIVRLGVEPLSGSGSASGTSASGEDAIAEVKATINFLETKIQKLTSEVNKLKQAGGR